MKRDARSRCAGGTRGTRRGKGRKNEGERSLQFSRGERNESASLYLPGMGCTLHAKAKGMFLAGV